MSNLAQGRVVTETVSTPGVEPHRLAERLVDDPAGAGIDGAALVSALETAVAGR
jgi:hypothetical protein